MEITINETNKTIKVNGIVSIAELVRFIGKYNLEEYSIIGTETIQYYPVYTPPVYPFPQWEVTTGSMVYNTSIS